VDANDVLALGLGISPPWKLVGQRLDTDKRPKELHIELAADRGALFSCPDCARPCKAHDFAEFTWRHLNFFQHHCYITAKVPRTACPDHGVKRIQTPWAREGSRFTLLFEQAALILAREMPVLAAARIIGITDQRLWRIVEHYVGQAVARLDLTRLRAIGLDETASKRGHNYVTVFIDLDRTQKPVVFVTPGKGKQCLARFHDFLVFHGGEADGIVEVVCDMSPAFLAAIGETFEQANVTVDWFHVVQLFTKAVDDVRKAEAKHTRCPRRCAGPCSRLPTAGSPRSRWRPWPNSRPPTCSRQRRGGSRKNCVGYATQTPSKPPAGGSPASSATPVNASPTKPFSSPSERRSKLSKIISTAFFSAGPRPTPTPASKG
jgi:transposase